MTAPVVTTDADEAVDAAKKKMTFRRCRHLPILVDGKLAGVVAVGDVINHRLEQIEHKYQAMREYIATA
jgi:CBS domain-containing protein